MARVARLPAEVGKRERALRLRVQEKEPHPGCSEPEERALALWGTMARAAREQHFARARMAAKAEVQLRRALAPVKRKKAAKTREL